MDKKYRIDTMENKQFMRQLGLDLLRFGHQIVSPQGGAYYLGDDGTPMTERTR